jgi:hypothetical protein
MRHPRHTIATLAAIGAALPMAVPLAAQAQPDHPISTPPAIPTSSLAGTTDATTAAAVPQDLRTPDAVDAQHSALIDKRSPDAVDAATRPRPVGSVQAAPAPTTTTTSDNGTDWGEIALIGGTAAGLLAIAGGTLLVTQRRTSGRRRQPAA